MSSDDHFSAGAAAYASHRPVYPTALVDWLAHVAHRDAPVWDAGCGSGQLSLLLAARFERVIATDASTAQLAHAVRHERVHYACAVSEAAPLADRSIGLAVAAQAAHWFDLARYYAEVRRTVRSDGVIALVTYGNLRVGADVDSIVQRFRSETLARYWPEERCHVDQHYLSLPFPFPALHAPDLVMTARCSAEQLLGYIGTWSAVRALQMASGPGAFDRFRERVLAQWPPDGACTVTWPLTVRAGRV